MTAQRGSLEALPEFAKVCGEKFAQDGEKTPNEKKLIKVQLKKNIKQLVDATDMHHAVTSPMGLMPESPIHDAFYRAQDVAIEGFSEDYRETVRWFLQDCDCGRSSQGVGYEGGDMVYIETVDELVDFIVGGMHG